ncbi:MAG: hypothetical protein HYZ11_16610 [Candidatus Tectomicrobia bacterium]|uniref:Alginate export domain-containing protein n=1 Tax=Tectimicrobiota bacterium TaxID=2528274 RepID=A0A932I4M7_UNCTE|nr:hypothetical protein [Candidatus Tectomicrobia bacterium]
MRKYLLALAVALLAASLAAPSYAADFKYTGIFRIRGITAEDLDRNENLHDGFQYYDALVRPRFTATSEGGRIWAIYELDYNSGLGGVGSGGANHLFGSTTGDAVAAVNRWLIDFAVPGTTLRARVGRTDYTDPTSEIFDSNGLHRQDGLALYGRLFGPVSLSVFTVKLSEGLTAATDSDNYYLALKWQAAPQIAITPWFGVSRRNGTTAATDYSRYYYALHGQAKLGILDLELQGIYENGTHAENGGVGGRDIDLDAYALLLRSWLTFGKLKLGFYLTWLSGEDNPDNNDFEGFVFPTQAGALDIPNIITGVRYSTITRAQTGATGNNLSSASGIGTGTCTQASCRANGLLVPELLAVFQVTPALDIVGNISYVESAEKITSDGFTNDKDVGWVFEAGLKWKIYKQLALWGFGSYLSAGDYGKIEGGRAPDDAWALYYELRHTW